MQTETETETAGLRGYLRVLSYPPAALPFFAAVIARLPVSMGSLGMILLIEHVRGAYSIAGIVTGTFALMTAAAAPLWGRLMDRYGQPKIIIPTSLTSATALITLSLVTVAGAPTPVMVALAALTGVAFPPISPAMRSAWRVIYPPGPSRRLGFALDAASVELIFVGGPLLLSLLAINGPPALPLIVTASLMAAGSLAYASTHAARTWAAPPTTALLDDASQATRSRHAARSALVAPGLAALLVVASAMAVGFGQLDTSIVATADRVLGGTDRLGFLFAAIAGGSTIGGLAYGAMNWPGDELKRMARTLAAFALTVAPLPILLLIDKPHLWILLPLLFLAGLTIAPTLIMFQAAIDHLAPPHRMTEAQAFLSASQTSGAALGTAIAGFAIDHFGPTGGFTGAIIAIALSATVATLYLRRWRAVMH